MVEVSRQDKLIISPNFAKKLIKIYYIYLIIIDLILIREENGPFFSFCFTVTIIYQYMVANFQRIAQGRKSPLDIGQHQNSRWLSILFYTIFPLTQIPRTVSPPNPPAYIYTIDAKTSTTTPDSQVPEFQSLHFMQCRLRTNELRRMNEEIEVGLNFGLIFFD